jgi:ribonuclease HI
MAYYAVAKGHNIGIYNFWNDCKEQILGYKGAVYKKFNNEKDAEEYILNIASVTSDIFENLYSRFNIEEVDYFIYTDGSCYNNGDINAVSGIGIFFGINNKKNVSKVINSIDNNDTNNSAELYAIIEAYKIVKEDLKNNIKICIFTDSEYCIKCATSYGEKCNSNNWEKNIPNKELVKEIYNIYNNNQNLLLKHIRAHTNKKDKHSIGNSNADKLAYNAIKNYKKDLTKKV